MNARWDKRTTEVSPVFADRDSCDAPPGDDPKIRHDRGHEWFYHLGCWWQTGCLPPDVRAYYLQETMRRDRIRKEQKQCVHSWFEVTGTGRFKCGHCGNRMEEAK